MSKPKREREAYGEPWGPAAIFVERMLNVDEYYVANWAPKQVKWLAQVKSLIMTTEQYLGFKVPWLNQLVEEYMKLSKFEDGWTIKQARDVARGSSTRMMLNIARWRKIFFGEEAD